MVFEAVSTLLTRKALSTPDGPRQCKMVEDHGGRNA